MKPLLVPALLLAGCATTGSTPPEMGVGTCAADKAQMLVGQAATQELGAKALSLTGARTIRWIQPGQAVTMDYRQDRLNISMDGANKVERVSCG